MMKLRYEILLCVFLGACGGGGSTVANDSPPDVEGIYSCTEGCDGPDCTFDDRLDVVQTGDDVIISADNFGDAVGTVNNEGEFTVSNDTVDCEGQFVDGIAVTNCIASGTTCQQATYNRL